MKTHDRDFSATGKRLMVGLAVSLVLFLVIVALLTAYRYTVYLPRDAETMDWAHSARTEAANHLGIDL